MLWYKIIAHSIGITQNKPVRDTVEYMHNNSVRTYHDDVYVSKSFKMLYNIFNDFYKYDFAIQKLDNDNKQFYKIFTFTFEVCVCDNNDKLLESKIVDASEVDKEIKCYEILNYFARNPKYIKKDYLAYREIENKLNEIGIYKGK